MGKTVKAGCSASKAAEFATEAKQEETNVITKKEAISMVKIGSPAPDFKLQGYHKGEFKEFSLSEFKGKWVLLCFYPGDFTFV